MTTMHFSSRARTQRNRSAASRGSLYFAWGCFRDFLSRPCLAPPKGRYAGSGTRDRQCLALTGRIDPVPTHHALGLAEARRHPHASSARNEHRLRVRASEGNYGIAGDASALLRLQAGGAAPPAPCFGFPRDQLAELGGRARERFAADGGKPCLH